MDYFNTVQSEIAEPKHLPLLDLKTLKSGEVLYVKRIVHRLVPKFGVADVKEDAFLAITEHKSFFLPGRLRNSCQKVNQEAGLSIFDDTWFIYGGSPRGQHIFFIAKNIVECTEKYKSYQAKLLPVSTGTPDFLPESQVFSQNFLEDISEPMELPTMTISSREDDEDEVDTNIKM